MAPPRTRSAEGLRALWGYRLLETVTHARLRVQQGDRAGAVRILRAVLARRPGDLEAMALLRDLPLGQVPQPEPEEPAPAPATSAKAAELAATFRRALAPSSSQRRLRRFLAAVSRHAR